VIGILQHIRPDILLVNEFDWDVESRAAKAFMSSLNVGPNALDYRFFFDSEPNSGRLSGYDLNNDGKTRGPEDAFGYGKFPGQYGMLLLSRFPINKDDARSFTKLLWSDLEGASLPTHADETPFPSELRNADEIRFWTHYLNDQVMTDDQARTAPRSARPAVVLGDLNADPNDGDGIHSAINNLLNHPALQDIKPASQGGLEAAKQGPANDTHMTDPTLDTADWNDTRGPGNLRVDYALPTRDITIKDAGVFWPASNDPLHALLGSGKSLSSDHRLVWLDIDW